MQPSEVTIIVAEDSAPNRRIMVQLLKKLGINVIECEDGALAWEALEEIDNVKNTAIISDIMMPDTDGMELLEKVRGSEKYKDMHFMFVSTLADKDHILKAKQLNADGYLLKPITFDQLKQKVMVLFPDLKIKVSLK